MEENNCVVVDFMVGGGLGVVHASVEWMMDSMVTSVVVEIDFIVG